MGKAHMTTIEVRVRANNKWRILLIPPIVIGLFYYLFGYLPVSFWILGGALLVLLPFSLLRGTPEGPCIVLSDRGLFDRRLKVGLIRWVDIRKAYLYSLHGVEYVCLDLHNLESYVERRPAWLTVLASPQRLLGMGPIAIGTGGLDINSRTLLARIQQGCQAAHQE